MFGRAALGALLVLAWSAIGHQSGSGWVQVLGALVAAVLVLGFAAPAIAVSKVRVEAGESPADAEAGTPFRVLVACSRPARLEPVSPAGPQAVGCAHAPAELWMLADRRGVIPEITLRVSSAAPFGLVWWTRTVVLRLARPVHVAPRLGLPLPDVSEGLRRGIGGARVVLSLSGELRSVRDYRHGDSPRRVHWPATAHSASLMVRENEESAGTTVVVRADIPADPAAGERRAEHVLGTIVELLSGGASVVLETVEAGAGPVSDEVADRVTTGRRLARAVGTVREAAGAPRTAGRTDHI